MKHLSDEALWALMDDSLSEGERRATSAHLAGCAECRALLERARRLRGAVDRAPRSMAPPEDAWTEIRARIGARPLAPAERRSAMPRSRWLSPGWLAAAAVLLVVLSSMVTAWVMRGDGSRAIAPTVASESGAPDERDATPRFVATDEQERMERELSALLEAQRSTLTPETVAKIERNLDVIDAAIEEIKTALAEDPNNRALHDLLSASYRQKAALLKQASQIS
jgi:hypothetical protein